MLPVPQWYAAQSSVTKTAGFTAPVADRAGRSRLARLIGVGLIRAGRALARRGGHRRATLAGGYGVR